MIWQIKVITNVTTDNFKKQQDFGVADDLKLTFLPIIYNTSLGNRFICCIS